MKAGLEQCYFSVVPELPDGIALARFVVEPLEYGIPGEVQAKTYSFSPASVDLSPVWMVETDAVFQFSMVAHSLVSSCCFHFVANYFHPHDLECPG